MSCPIPTRQENFFAGFSSSEKSENFPFLFSRLDDDVPLVGVVVFSARRRSRDLREGELPIDGPIAQDALIDKEHDSSTAHLKCRQKNEYENDFPAVLNST